MANMWKEGHAVLIQIPVEELVGRPKPMQFIRALKHAHGCTCEIGAVGFQYNPQTQREESCFEHKSGSKCKHVKPDNHAGSNLYVSFPTDMEVHIARKAVGLI